MISLAEFSRTIGVSKPAVSKAVSKGRVPVYDETGLRVGADYKGRKFVKVDEASAAFRLSRARVDDAVLAQMAAEIDAEIAIEADAGRAQTRSADISPSAGKSLVGAKTEKEELQADLLRLRLARERGELVSRAVQIDAFETAGRQVARAMQAMPAWAEELHGVAHASGVPGLTAWLRAKANELCANLADMMTAQGDDEVNDGDSGSDAVP